MGIYICDYCEKWKDKDFDGYNQTDKGIACDSCDAERQDKAELINDRRAERCKCGSTDIITICTDTVGYKQCDDCGWQWDHA